MLAIEITNPGADAKLSPAQHVRPEARDGEVLIRVAAAGVNRPDVLQRQGRYPLPPYANPLPGLEIAGEIIQLGPGVTQWQTGDRVMALTHGGGYAEYCVAPATHCLPVPASMSMIEAAAVPETFFTVWYNVFMRASLLPGETLLVHGGSSGIGSAAIQLAIARGSKVVTTAGSDSKCRFCEALGAVAFNYREGDWAEAVAAHCGSVDVVLDMVAGSYVQKNIDLLSRDGRYCLIAFLDGSMAKLNLRRILTHRLTLTGSTLRPQTIAEKAAIAAELQTQVLPLLASGQVKPVIHRTFSLLDASAAHELMESGEHMGKIVLELNNVPP